MGDSLDKRSGTLPNKTSPEDNLNIDPIFIEGSKIKKKQDFFLNNYDRLWGEKVTYSVGISYSAGLLIGTTYGFFNAIKKPALTNKLKINSILNECTIKGTKFANPMSIITMFYCGIYRTSKAIRQKDDSLNSVISGAISGALYKSSSSRKVMARYSLFSTGK